MKFAYEGTYKRKLRPTGQNQIEFYEKFDILESEIQENFENPERKDSYNNRINVSRRGTV